MPVPIQYQGSFEETCMKNRPVAFVMKIYSRLILVLALLLVGCVTQLKNKAFDWAGHSCVFTGEYDTPGFFSTASYPPEYNGTFRCTNPDGSHLTCPNTNQPAPKAEFQARVTFPRDITEKNFWASMGCGASIPQATSTPTASPAPAATATFTPMPTATPAALLSGEVSACSTKDGFINFKLAVISPLVNESDVVLTINGAQVSCTFAGSDNSLLSCPLPAGVAFPAQIHVNIGTAPVNDFTYDGGGCVTQTGSGGGEGAVPTPKLGD
jgi:hypothetical protein